MSKPVAGGAVQALRKVALRYPSAQEGIACEGTPIEKRTVRVGKKAFLFLGAADMMVKLRESLAAAVRLASKEPERYEVGANGWVTAQLGDAPPLDLLEKWVDESYRVVVNKGVDLAQDRRPPRAKRKPTVGK